MGWEDKLEAMNQLARCSLEMRKPGDWYVHWRGVEIGGDGFLRSVPGNGKNPEAAIENLWLNATAIPEDRYLTKSAYGDDRKQYRWTGYMWGEVSE